MGGSDSKASAYNAGDPGSVPRSGRSPGEGNGNLLQYSCLENPMDGGAWEITVHGVTKSRTWLGDFTSLLMKDTYFFQFLEDSLIPWLMDLYSFLKVSDVAYFWPFVCSKNFPCPYLGKFLWKWLICLDWQSRIIFLSHGSSLNHICKVPFAM